MTTKMLMVLLVNLILAVQDCMGLGFQQASPVYDLAGLGLPSPNIRVTESMYNVIKMMQDVERLPSCQKQASQSLLDSCSDFDGVNSKADQQTTEKTLQKSKSVYAARLAICELVTANDDNIPSSCTPFMPITASAGLKGFVNIGRSNVNQVYYKDTDLYECLKSLNSKSVWWVSYSNAIQNALLMCHTMRSELDKDDLLEKTKLMFEAVMEAHNIQADTNQESRVFEQKWNEMSKGMESFHTSLNSDLETQRKIMEQWARFRDSVHDLENGIQDLGREVGHVKEVSTDIVADLKKHRLNAQDAHTDLAQQVSQIMESSVAIDRVQQNSLSNSMMLDSQGRELADFLTRSIGAIQGLNQDTQAIAYLVTDMMHNMTDAVKIVSDMREDLDSFSFSILGRISLGVVVLFVFTCSVCFAVLHTWGPFNSTGSVAAALGSGSGLTYIATEIPQVIDKSALDLLLLLAFISVAFLTSCQWYRQQYAAQEVVVKSE